jgi:transitional endoplasmic reticulum ATPase
MSKFFAKTKEVNNNKRKSLQSANDEHLRNVQVISKGDQILIPEDMELEEAVVVLEKTIEDNETQVNEMYNFDCMPQEGAVAMTRAVENIYGISIARATPTMFGPQPPTMISVQVAPDQFYKAIWGRIEVPDCEGGTLETSASLTSQGWKFVLATNTKRKFTKVIERIVAEVTRILKEEPIYRGSQMHVKFLDNNGQLMRMPEIRFIDTKSFEGKKMVYSKVTEDAIETNLFTPIMRVKDTKANGIPIKRGVLLAGTYGTGKTLAAYHAALLAAQQGITFIYINEAAELSHAVNMARAYDDPAAVVFCEDIDRSMTQDRDEFTDRILNIVDGIDSKDSNIIIVLTTNELENITKAMLRPGRLDAVIPVDPPDAEAVGRLIRVYAGNLIKDDEDISKVCKIMEGSIPAVIVEMINRAKLAEVKRLPEGGMIERLSAESLIESAHTMSRQIELLTREDKAPPVTIDDLVGKAVKKLTDEFANEVAGKIN